MSKQTISRVAKFLLPLFFLVSSVTVARAEEVDSKNQSVVTDLKKGQKAPYDGILFSLRMAAEVKENCDPAVLKHRCDVRVQEATGLKENECAAKTFVLETKLTEQKEKFTEQIQARDAYIKKLEDGLPKWHDNPRLWFGIGLVIGGGVVFTIAKNVK